MLDWWRNAGGFSPMIPDHPPLNRRILEVAKDYPEEAIWNREIRPGTARFPAHEMAQRIPQHFPRLRIKHELSKTRFKNRKSHSYLIFQSFYPSVILNYNHDGLVGDQCGTSHKVIDAHIVIEEWYGSPLMTDVIDAVRDFDLRIPSDDLILCVPESHKDCRLKRRLQMAGSLEPNFIATIGYSFARNGTTYDDYVSLHWFKRRFHNFRGNIYVVDPLPEPVQYMISDALQSRNVFGIRARWNVLSHVFVRMLYGMDEGKSVTYVYERLFDATGGRVAFPHRGRCGPGPG
jgi:hypothetical protein